MQEIRIQISPNEWHESNDEPPPPPGVSIRRMIVMRYSVDARDVLGFVVQIGVGVTTSMIASYLYDYFKDHKTKTVTLLGKGIIKRSAVDRKDLEEAVDHIMKEDYASSHALDDLIDDGFLLTLPLYSFLFEPGPQLGYLRDGKKEIIFVPLWTDIYLFEDYISKSGLTDKIAGLKIDSPQELVTYLRKAPSNVHHVMIDPTVKVPQKFHVFELAKLLGELEK